MSKKPICKNQFNLTPTEIKLSLLLAYCADAAYFNMPKAPDGYEHFKEKRASGEYQGRKLETVVQVFTGNTEATKNKSIIAFRGTDSLIDVLADADFILRPWEESHHKEIGPNVEVHEGFYIFYKIIKRELKLILKELPKGQLYITGHSLGSAVATLFQFDLMLGGLDQLANKFDYRQINFACPRVGNMDFAQAYRDYDKGNTLRIVNEKDIVPCVPLNEMHFFHASDFWLLSFEITDDSLWRHLLKSIAGRHSMINYFQILYLMVGRPNLGQHPRNGTWKLGSGNQVKALEKPKNSLNYYHCDRNQSECSSELNLIIKYIFELIRWILKHAPSSIGENRMIISSEKINQKWQEIYHPNSETEEP